MPSGGADTIARGTLGSTTHLFRMTVVLLYPTLTSSRAVTPLASIAAMMLLLEPVLFSTKCALHTYEYVCYVPVHRIVFYRTYAFRSQPRSSRSGFLMVVTNPRSGSSLRRIFSVWIFENNSVVGRFCSRSVYNVTLQLPSIYRNLL